MFVLFGLAGATPGIRSGDWLVDVVL